MGLDEASFAGAVERRRRGVGDSEVLGADFHLQKPQAAPLVLSGAPVDPADGVEVVGVDEDARGVGVVAHVVPPAAAVLAGAASWRGREAARGIVVLRHQFLSQIML